MLLIGGTKSILYLSRTLGKKNGRLKKKVHFIGRTSTAFLYKYFFPFCIEMALYEA
jgi:hypothetical protein